MESIWITVSLKFPWVYVYTNEEIIWIYGGVSNTMMEAVSAVISPMPGTCVVIWLTVCMLRTTYIARKLVWRALNLFYVCNYDRNIPSNLDV
jgi:hypothetical protein